MTIKKHKIFFQHLSVLVTLSLFCGIIYSNTLHAPFILDDQPNISNNNSIKLVNIDLPNIYEAAFKSPNNHRPVANLSFALNYYFGKDDVFGYHLINIVIHIANAILVYLITLLTIKQFSFNLKDKNYNYDSYIVIFSSAIAAGVFVAHPLQVQSVTYIVQRMNSMAAMFYFLSLLLFILGRLTEIKRHRLVLWLCGFLSWLFSLSSKEIAATLPVIIFLYEWYFFQDLNKEWINKNKRYFIFIAIILLILSFVLLGAEPLQRIISDYQFREFTIGERILTQFRVIVFYITLMILPLPSRLNVLHEFSLSYSLFNPATTIVSLVIITTLIMFSFFIMRKQKIISFCILWFFINLVIESSIIGLEIIFEHRLYLPMYSFSLLIGFYVFRFYGKSPKLIVLSSLIFVVVLGIATYSRNSTWQNEIRLWEDVVTKNPQSYRANYNLGNAYKDKGYIDSAIRHYKVTILIRPTHTKAYNNLGNALKQKGSLNEALYYYEKGLEIDKDDSVTHYNLGNLMLLNGDHGKATYYYKQAINLDPNYSKAYNNLGIVMARLNKTDDALLYFTKANRLDPEYIDALLNLARAHWLKNNIDVACNYYRQILIIEPEYSFSQKEILENCQL